MRKILTTIAVMTIVIAAAGTTAKAVNTASNTVITNFATMTATGISTVTSNTATNTVQDIYGLGTFSQANSTDKSVAAGSYATYTVAVVNNGNTTDNIGVKIGAQAFNGTPGTLTSWSVQVDDADPFVASLTWDGGFATALQTGDQATASALISPGAAATFTLKVNVAADAADSATMAFTLQVQTYDTLIHPAAAYTGFNGTNYGGPAFIARTVGSQGAATVTTTVLGAVLTLAKSASVTAPAGYSGGASDPVPGAKITYTLTYNNTGGGPASSIVIKDFVPTNTTYLATSITTTNTHIGGASGAKTDTNDGDGCDFNLTTAGAVTCTAATVPSGQSGTVTYSVTID